MSEDPPPTPAPQLRRTRRSVASESETSPEVLRLRRRKLYLINGILGGVALALVLILVLRSSKPAAPPVPPPLPPPTGPKPPPKTSAAPVEPRSVEDRMADLARLEKESPKSFRTLHEQWTKLLGEPASPRVHAAVREQIERIESAANKEYRERYRPVQEEVRELLGSRRPREAVDALKAWKVPAELDLGGAQSRAVRKEIAAAGELIDFEDARSRVLAEYQAGRYGKDADEAFGSFLTSDVFQLRTAAENALPELRMIRALGLIRERLEARRGTAAARVEDVKRQVARDAALEKERLASWEARLREKTKKDPIPLRRLGVDMDAPLHVARYNGRNVTLAGPNMELTFGLDQLPADLFGKILTQAPDPARAPELFEAGKIAVRQGAFPAAQELFGAAVRLDRSYADLVPDLARLRRSVGTLRGEAVVAGDQLTLTYAFQSPEEGKDFTASPGTKLSSDGMLALTGKGMFTAALGDLKFQGRLAVSADPGGARGTVGYIVGASFEVLPGESDLLVALVEADRAYRIFRLPRGGRPQVLGEGPLSTRGGIEISFASPRIELKIGGATVWTGALADFAVLQPVVGGYDFSGGGDTVAYRSLRFEGRASPGWIQRLQSERLTVLEAELSRESRTTREERAAGRFSRSREFGLGIGKPLELEAELKELMPPRVGALFAGARAAMKEMEKARSPEAFRALGGQVRQCLEDAVQEAPWFPLGYYYRAEWLYLHGDSARALQDLGEAVARQEGFVEARVARAELLLRQAKYPEAGKEIDAALAAVPDLAPARLTRALLHYYGGREAEAVAELELARRLEPGDLVMRRSAKRLANIVAGPRWSGVVTHETPHYTIKAEFPKLPRKGRKEDPEKAVRERAQKYAAHLDAAREYFAKVAPGGQGKPRARKPLVFICDTPESYYTYADFTAEDRLEHTAGVYMSAFQQLLFFRAETEEETLETMTHEAFHEYLNSVIPAAPIWLNEGMAEYVSGIAVADGRVTETGRVLKGRLRALQAALEYGWEGFPFEVVFQETKEQFYAIAPEIQYAQAWSMVHFLMHFKGGKYQPVLEGYLKRLIETGSPWDAVEAFKGHDLEQMRREWLSYVKTLR